MIEIEIYALFGSPYLQIVEPSLCGFITKSAMGENLYFSGNLVTNAGYFKLTLEKNQS